MEKIKHKSLIIFCLISLLIGVIGMLFFNKYTELKFQYSNNIEIKHNVLIKIIKIQKLNKLIDSPSFVDHVPNPLLIKGVVVKDGLLKENTKIKLIIPEQELKNIKKDSIISLGLIDEKSVISLEGLSQK